MIRFRGLGILAPFVYFFAIPYISLLGAPYRKPDHGDPRFWCITGLAVVAAGVMVLVFGLLLNRGRADSQGNVPHDLMGCSVEGWGVLGIVLGIVAQPVAGVLLLMNWIDPPVPQERLEVNKRVQELKSDNVDARQLAADRLALLGEEAKAAIPALIEATKDDDERVRDAAERALAILEPTGIAKRKEQATAEKRKAEIKKAIQELKSDDEGIRGFAAKRLGELGPDSAEAIPLLTELLKGQSRFAREAAEEALAVLEPEGAPARGRHVKNSLQKLRDALQEHEIRHLYSLDPKKKKTTPGLSWRVELLPYLGKEALYRKFKLDEPWDSPANLPLVEQMPEVFAPPRTGVATKPGHTYLQMLVDAKDVAGAATPNVRSVVSPIPRSVHDSAALRVVEARVAVPWTKPADLPIANNWPLPPLGHAMPHAFGALIRFDHHPDVAEMLEPARMLSQHAPAKYLQPLTASRPIINWFKVDLKLLRPENNLAAKESGTLQGKVLWRNQPQTTGWIALVTDDGREYAAPFDADGGYQISEAPIGQARLVVVLGRADVPIADWLRSGESVQVRPGTQNRDVRLD